MEKIQFNLFVTVVKNVTLIRIVVFDVYVLEKENIAPKIDRDMRCFLLVMRDFYSGLYYIYTDTLECL